MAGLTTPPPPPPTLLHQIAGSANGRIFLGGSDGCVYELVYHEERGVLSELLNIPAKTRKINRTSTIVGYAIATQATKQSHAA